MIVKDDVGNELIDVINVKESEAENLYSPVTHSLAVVKIGNDYLMGWNHWRKNWEVFGGCREEEETMRECIIRECNEELGLSDVKFTFIGLMKYKMAPGYFSSEWHEEYGGLYGVSLSEDMIETIKSHRKDREEIEKLELYSNLQSSDRISIINEKLLEYWS